MIEHSVAFRCVPESSSRAGSLQRDLGFELCGAFSFRSFFFSFYAFPLFFLSPSSLFQSITAKSRRPAFSCFPNSQRRKRAKGSVISRWSVRLILAVIVSAWCTRLRGSHRCEIISYELRAIIIIIIIIITITIIIILSAIITIESLLYTFPRTKEAIGIRMHRGGHTRIHTTYTYAQPGKIKEERLRRPIGRSQPREIRWRLKSSLIEVLSITLQTCRVGAFHVSLVFSFCTSEVAASAWCLRIPPTADRRHTIDHTFAARGCGPGKREGKTLGESTADGGIVGRRATSAACVHHS